MTAVFDFESGTVEVEGAPASTTADGFITIGRDNPEQASAISKRLLEEDGGDEPLITPPPPGLVTLAAGLVRDGTVYTDAQVRELNGADEEAMAKATSAARLIDVVIKRATEHLGPLDNDALERVMDDLLIGDRMLLLMGVRIVTFGDNVRLDVTCPHCTAAFQVDYSFTDDVSVKKLELEEPSQRVFEVPLPSGKVATVRMVDGKAQKAVYTADNMRKSDPELNTLLLQQVVESIDGKPVKLLSHVREELGAGDRRELLSWLAEHQPGPQFGDVTHECPECERSFPLVVDLLDSFRT